MKNKIIIMDPGHIDDALLINLREHGGPVIVREDMNKNMLMASMMLMSDGLGRRRYQPKPECFKDDVDRMTDVQIRIEMGKISRKESGLTKSQRAKVQYLFRNL